MPGMLTGDEWLMTADLKQELERKNQLLKALIQSRDVHDQRMAELQRQLERKNRLEVLGEMAAWLAHEIRNPLGGIELSAGMLRRSLEGDLKVTAQRLMEGVRTLNVLVDDILNFTRDLQLKQMTLAIEDILEDALNHGAHRMEEAGIRLHREGFGSHIGSFDPGMLSRVFLNIILNACDEMKEGGDLAVTVDESEGTGVVISFSDSGRGISDEAMKKLFTPFYSGKREGTGLGLAISYRVVEAHGGELTAENRTQGGAIFRVRLP